MDGGRDEGPNNLVNLAFSYIKELYQFSSTGFVNWFEPVAARDSSFFPLVDASFLCTLNVYIGVDAAH